MTVEVILPVLDEVEALPWVLDRMPPGHRAVVVDNGSSDGSGAVARGLGALVVEEPRRGFGAACAAGLAAATADVVAFCDADASLDPADLPAVTGPVAWGRADLVLGARAPIDPTAWPRHARLANRLIAAQLRRAARVAVTDLGPMRAGRREDLLALEVRDRRFGWPLEQVMRAAASGWRIEEVSIPYRHRVGRSKVTGTARGTLRATRDMALVWRELRSSLAPYGSENDGPEPFPDPAPIRTVATDPDQEGHPWTTPRA